MVEAVESALHASFPSISFRYLQPDSRLPLHRITSAVMQFLRIPLDRLNTKVAEMDPHLERDIHRLCGMPKMSTYAIGVLINRLVAQMSAEEAFVNVGVWHGFTYFSGVLSNGGKQCIAVDNYSSADKFSTESGFKRLYRYYPRRMKISLARSGFRRRMARMGNEHHRLFEMDYADYFKYVHETPIGVYLYDGNHSYENQMQGLQLAEPFFSKNCVVIVDDVNDNAVYSATRDFMAQSYNSYVTLMCERTYCDRHPTLWNGIMVFQRVAPSSPPVGK